MKIAAIVTHFPALSQTFILNQFTGLIDLGHDLDIFALRASKQQEHHADIDRYGLLARTFYRPRVPRHAASRTLKALGLVMRHGHKNPSSTLRSLNCRRYDSYMRTWELVYEATPFFGRRNYDIIHCHFGPNGLRGDMLRRLGAISGKLVTTFYGDDIQAPRKLKGDRIYDPLFDRCDLILALGHIMRKHLVALGCDSAKIQIHPLGVDTRKFKFNAQCVPDDGTVRVITVARHTEKKGLEYAIRAIARIASKMPNIEYQIVGDGPLRPRLEQLINQSNMRDKIKLAGWCRHDEVLTKLERAQILLLPSVTASDGDQEGTPTALIEACAMGMPVVSTLHSGIPEVVCNGRSGYLVPERDVDALVDRLGFLIDHPGSWKAMGTVGRHHVEKYFDVTVLNNRLVDHYGSLISCAPASSG